MEIRSTLASDLPHLIELFAQLGYPTTDALLQQRWPLFKATGADCFVAIVAGRVVGVLAQNYVLPLNTSGQYAIVSAFVIEQTLRRTGAGTALMQYAEQAALARDCTHTELSSSMRREPAHRFYEHYGFIENRKRYVKQYRPRTFTVV
jgi:GNAT superfamily N-acetyltransferase